ncbi:Tyrosyl-DNA phosphodiesterase 1 [Penicillium rolfsii]|nr:Tyrosyl-DNA phosphodiesterase 1 [Penicillium rolfsii]
MDPTILEQEMLEAAIKASLEDLQKQNQESSSQVSPSCQDKERVAQSASSSPSKGSSQAPGPSRMPSQPKASSQQSKPSKTPVVDLTKDSSSDSDPKENSPKSKSVIGSDTDNDIEADDDSDEDLRRAIAMSLEGARPDTAVSDLQRPESPPEAMNAPEIASAATSKPRGIFGIDRKQMEQERLARLAKRKCGRPPSTQPAPKASRLTEYDAPPRGRVLLSQLPPNADVRNNSSSSNSPSRVQPTDRPLMQYPLGAVKKTYVAGKPRMGNEITIEEVFQRGDLNVAVLSSFLWDIEWLFSKFDTKKTRFILMMGAKEESTRKQYREETASMPTLDLCFPPMEPQVNNMHSKLMLFYHPGYLRVAVPTANLTQTDWGENGIELGAKVETSNTAFKEELVYFLKASNLRDDAIKALEDFDFSQTARYAFVHTIGGSRTGEAWKRSGYCGLGRAVRQLGLQPSGPINIAYVSSSVGSLNDEFLRAIYLAAKGDDGLMDYKLRYTRQSTSQTNDPQRAHMLQLGQEWQNRFKVYFPSAQTVRLAHLDPDRTAGTVCFSSRWWLGEKFPRRVLKDCESERGVLMHNKLMYVWPSEPIQMPDGNKCQGWAYVGSANISESAWGRLIKDRTTGQPKLNCRNWECGVLVPVVAPGGRACSQASDATTITLDTATASESKSQQLQADIFQDTVPVPMKLPGADLTESRPPWFFQG